MLCFLEINGILQTAWWKFCIFFIQKTCQDSGILFAFETGTVLRSYILRRWKNFSFWVEIINVVRVALWFILPRSIDLVDESMSENLKDISDSECKDSSLSRHASLNIGVVEKLFGSCPLKAYHIHCCPWYFVSSFSK